MSSSNTEIVELASEGFFYPSGSVLASGVVEILPLTAVDEDVLCSGNLLRRGLVLPRILSRILPTVSDIDELLQCDVETILLNSRILNYGTSVEFNIHCTNCDSQFNHEASFSFKAKPFQFYGLTRGKNIIGFTFPVCKKSITFKLPTWREHRDWRPLGWVEFAKRITLSVDNEEDIVNFYETKLRAMDSKAFREFYEKQTPGFITGWKIQCPSCGNVAPTNVDIDTDIFNIKPESKSRIHDEIFSLCYHTNGGFTQDVVYNMPVSLRVFYIKKLIDLKNEENNKTKKQEAEVKAMSKTPSKPSIPNKKR